MHALLSDDEYVEAGATIEDDAIADADVVVSVQPLDVDRIRRLRRGTATVSFLPTTFEQAVVVDLRDCGITAFAMELVPRISRAQSMDALSSQALVAGYRCGDRGGRHAAPLLPAQHDRGRHRPAGRGRRARRRRRRPPGHRDLQAPRRGRPGVRRPRRRRGGDPLDGRQVDRPRAGDARGHRRLRARDDRGPRGPAARAADAVHRRRRRADHHRRRARAARRRCWSPPRWSSR